jgi:hypothetical protein
MDDTISSNIGEARGEGKWKGRDGYFLSYLFFPF